MKRIKICRQILTKLSLQININWKLLIKWNFQLFDPIISLKNLITFSKNYLFGIFSFKFPDLIVFEL